MPDFDDLRQEFDAQPTLPENRMSEIATLVRQRSDSLKSVLDKRDQQELYASILVGVVFAVFAIISSSPLSRFGSLIVVAGCVEIVIVMRLTRQTDEVGPLSLSLGESLRHEITKVKRQITLLRYVAWWYLLPIYLGTCLLVLGMGFDWFSVFFVVTYFVFCFFIWRANQTARKTDLEPLRDRLEAALHAVTNPDDPGIDNDVLIRELSHDTFERSCVEKLAPGEPSPDDVLHAVGRFIDSVIVFVFMFWGGVLAGGMIDAWLAGDGMGQFQDGMWSVVVSILAAAYSLWSKPINVSVLWGSFQSPGEDSDVKREDDSEEG